LLTPGAFCQECEPDDTIADVTAVRIGLAVLVNQAGRDLFHAEDRIVELEFAVIPFRARGKMSNFGDHSDAP